MISDNGYARARAELFRGYLGHQHIGNFVNVAFPLELAYLGCKQLIDLAY